MQELEKPLKIKTDTQIVAEIQKEYTLKGSVKKIPGLIMFMVDPIKMIAEPVKIQTKAIIDIKSKVKINHRAEFNPNMIYVQALNKSNDIRKIKKLIDKLNSK